MALWPFEMNTMPGLLGVWKPQTFRESCYLSLDTKTASKRQTLHYFTISTRRDPSPPDHKYNIQHTSAEINQHETASSKEVGERGSWLSSIQAPDFWHKNPWAMHPYASIWKASSTQASFFPSDFIYLFLFWPALGFRCCMGFSPVAARGGSAWRRCVGFSLQWLLLLQSTGSERWLSSCGPWA